MSSEAAPATGGSIADLPTGEPIPSSTSPIPPKKSSSLTLPSLPRVPSARQVDAFLTHLQKCMSTPSGIDTVLLLICYTSRLGSSILTSLATRLLHRSAAEWIALISANKTTTVVLSTDKAPVTRAAAASLVLAGRLKNLSGLLSEARTMLRLWALLGMYGWAKRLVSQSLAARRKSGADGGEKSAGEEVKEVVKQTTLDSAIAYSQLLVCIVFQALENGAYLSSKGVMGWDQAKQNWAMKWSARLWGVYVGIDLGRLAAEALNGQKGGITPQWKDNVLRQMAWAPLTVHWGSDKGVVPDWMVGALASIPGVLQMRELWAATA